MPAWLKLEISEDIACGNKPVIRTKLKMESSTAYSLPSENPCLGSNKPVLSSLNMHFSYSLKTSQLLSPVDF